MNKMSFMIKFIGKSAILILAVIFTSSFNSIRKKDCNSLILLDEGMKKLKKFTLIKDYPFSFREKRKKDPVEYLKQTITLNRDVRYKFVVIKNTEFEGDPIVSIYLSDKQEGLIATNYDARNNKFYEDIEFTCKTTGNLCLAFSFKDGKEGCAVGLYAFQKN